MVAAPSSYSYTTTKISQESSFWQASPLCQILTYAYTIRFKTNFINLMNFTNAFRLTVRLHSYNVEIKVLQAISACQILLANFLIPQIDNVIKMQLIWSCQPSSSGYTRTTKP